MARAIAARHASSGSVSSRYSDCAADAYDSAFPPSGSRQLGWQQTTVCCRDRQPLSPGYEIVIFWAIGAEADHVDHVNTRRARTALYDNRQRAVIGTERYMGKTYVITLRPTCIGVHQLRVPSIQYSADESYGDTVVTDEYSAQGADIYAIWRVFRACWRDIDIPRDIAREFDALRCESEMQSPPLHDTIALLYSLMWDGSGWHDFCESDDGVDNEYKYTFGDNEYTISTRKSQNRLTDLECGDTEFGSKWRYKFTKLIELASDGHLGTC